MFIGICERFPNTRVYIATRKVRNLNGYRAIVRTVESSAWSSVCVSTFKSAAILATLGAARDAAHAAANEAIATGYVPAF